MLSYESRQLADDHQALSDVLKQLREELELGNVEASHSRLDLFWARLAVHIRAEHLHLFPSVLKGLDHNTVGLPGLDEGQLAIERLRSDHDFFMHELGRALATLRELLKTGDRRAIVQGLRGVRETILEIEKRLLIHNEMEETQIYRWAATVLTKQEQLELATCIKGELAKRPPRFELNAWANQRQQ